MLLNTMGFFGKLFLDRETRSLRNSQARFATLTPRRRLGGNVRSKIQSKGDEMRRSLEERRRNRKPRVKKNSTMRNINPARQKTAAERIRELIEYIHYLRLV